jgi:multidrug resistance protein, MATE family
MRITFVPMIAQLIATVIHFPLCYLLVFQREMGLRGLGLAMSITNFNILLIVLVYCFCYKQISIALRKPDIESFKGWYEYLSIALPSTVIICSEWWAFEILTIISGLISIEAQAVQTIVTSGCAILFEIPLGYQEAACALIGNCIGAGNV